MQSRVCDYQPLQEEEALSLEKKTGCPEVLLLSWSRCPHIVSPLSEAVRGVCCVLLRVKSLSNWTNVGTLTSYPISELEYIYSKPTVGGKNMFYVGKFGLVFETACYTPEFFMYEDRKLWKLL